MIKVEIKYNGKTYKDFGKALEKAMTDGIVEEINNQLQEMLAPFSNEINQNNGIVTAEIMDGQVKIELKDMPQELIDRIEATIG